MSYSYNKFLRPITSSDKNIKILDDSNDIKYTIDPFVILNVSVSNNILKINLKSKRIISLHFSTINEAKLALTRIRIQIDTLIQNTPYLIDRDVQNYVDTLFNKVSIIVGPTGATGAADRYSATSSTPFQIPIVGEVINLQTQTNLAYTPAQSVIIYNDIPNLYDNNYEEGGDYFISKIDSYDKNTGDMTIVVDFSTSITTGETYSFWYMNLSGEKGQADRYYTTSFTTLSVPQIGEVVDLEIETYLAYSSSQNVVVYSDLPNLYDNDYQIEGGYFSGQVDYYDFSTGLISIVVDNFIGEGTYSTWYMNLSGVPGIDGTTASNINLTNLTTDIIPAFDSQYSLGTSASQWKSLHVSGQTIYIGGVPLSTDGESLVVSSINLGTTASPLILSANNDVLLLNGTGSVGATGATGLQGPTGANGLQGPIGPTGADGSSVIPTFAQVTQTSNTTTQSFYQSISLDVNTINTGVFGSVTSSTNPLMIGMQYIQNEVPIASIGFVANELPLLRFSVNIPDLLGPGSDLQKELLFLLPFEKENPSYPDPNFYTLATTDDIGATGPTGPQGATGSDGLQGPIGPTGADGLQGTQGIQGPTGPQGATGSDGLQGPIGPTGADGLQGTQGPTGATGPQGIQGATGSSGISPATGSWNLSTGANTVSFTVTAGQSYVMWINGNIPNGIVNWNATVTLSNSNVPVIGTQYGWYYLAGNALVLTSIPSQIVGTPGTIITSSPAVSNSNTFTFGITNNSGSSQIVYYGYVKIS